MNDKSHAATPTNATPDQSVSEPCDGISGPVSGAPALTTKLSPETVADRLKRIYPEHYVRILSEATRTNGAEHTARMLEYPSNMFAVALSAMFIWERSAEGEGFWAELAERECSGGTDNR